jgi:hypothetical protein
VVFDNLQHPPATSIPKGQAFMSLWRRGIELFSRRCKFYAFLSPSRESIAVELETTGKCGGDHSRYYVTKRKAEGYEQQALDLRFTISISNFVSDGFTGQVWLIIPIRIAWSGARYGMYTPLSATFCSSGSVQTILGELNS